ncbi:urease accessory protein UreD [Pararoseomonas indoligenes]|uniref:Urease accessory protein UreD n=1 Tax=Roseomonas indoligenes TaxID=2820811 RepID=A0A940SA67_9PROT|nr:urease accessory protein UreD [Pararoseomonas indoligenes]
MTAEAPRHQRADGGVEIVFGVARGRTVLRHLYQSSPMRVLFPDAEPGTPITGALVNTAGGLAGGDMVRVQARVEEGATATLCTPAAEKLYRSLGPETRIGTALHVGPGAVLEWLPQETILFDRARLRRRLDVELSPGARLLATEMLVFGRAARGERFREGFLHDAWRLRVNGRLRWADALRIEVPDEALEDRFGFAGAGGFATLLYAGADAAERLPVLRDLAGPLGAATVPREGVALIRWLGPAMPVRAALAAAIPALRAALFGLPPALPRLWTT